MSSEVPLLKETIPGEETRAEVPVGSFDICDEFNFQSNPESRSGPLIIRLKEQVYDEAQMNKIVDLKRWDGGGKQGGDEELPNQLVLSHLVKQVEYAKFGDPTDHR